MEELSKKKKEKHDHRWTKLLQVSIFAILMLAPFFAVVVKSLYALNTNAKESYYGETINEQRQQRYTSNLDLYNKYNIYFDNSALLNTEKSGTFTYSYVDIVSGNFANPTAENIAILHNSNRAYVYRGTSITFYDDDNNTTFVMTSMSGVVLKFDLITSLPNSDISFAFYTIVYNKYSYIDNVFYYSVNQLKEEDIFNWSRNTGIYTTIKTMTDGLGINEVVPMLLAYWSILTAVYIVFDIIIFCFVHITHFLSD